ncbi:MAG: 23S rRNA (uracil(1939)-C(5))-methyltransferase RlmD [Saprospiraceae bacterium]|nr:23S rRNA (uracil(1939)-C(5))-methyltransferase RlmD [Saprospiraceae bacterium]
MSKQRIAEKVEVTGIADKGKAVGRDAAGEVVFMTDAIPGDIVDVQLLRRKKGVWQGVPVHYHQQSVHRQEPVCRHFEDCGGCKWQHMNYTTQLHHKEQIVRDAMNRIAKMEITSFLPIIGAENTFHYRNKMEFSFSPRRWKTKQEVVSGKQLDEDVALGFHPPGFFDKVVDITECWLQDDKSNEIRNFVRAYALEKNLTFFDPREHHGFLRNLIIRNTTLNEWMLSLVFYYEDKDKRLALLEAVSKKFIELESIQYVINEKKNDSLFDQRFHVFRGKDHILESLNGLHFKIGPKSFFQTNAFQAKKLYDLAKSFCGFEGNEIVYDLYSGIGSIAMYIANRCRAVIGVEEIDEAVADAEVNAALNGLSNVHFYCGDVKEIWNDSVVRRHGHPDIVITDPPRGGMHDDVVQTICQLLPNKVVYISCNPATQARDIAKMSDRYSINKMQPVDMFPHTSHIENVTLLVRR